MREQPHRTGRVGGNATERRLEPGDAAEGAWDANGAAAIGADGEGTDTGGERRGRAGAAAARRVREVPWVARDAGQRRIAERLPAEFRRRRLAEEDGTMLAQPRHRRRILIPRLIALGQKRAAQGRPALRQDDILDRRRHAVDQALRRPLDPARLRFPRRGDRAFGIDEDKRIELGLEALEPGQRRLCRLDRRQRLAAIGVDECARRHESELAVAEHAMSLHPFTPDYPGKTPAPQPSAPLQSQPVTARWLTPSPLAGEEGAHSAAMGR